MLHHQLVRIIAAMIIILSFPLFSVSQNAPIPNLSDGQQEAIEALAIYPSVIQSHILEASQYPGILTRLAELRKKSTDKFNSMLEDYSESVHDKIYSISRYPELFSLNDNDELSLRTDNYPDSVNEAATYLLENHMDVLRRIENIEYEVKSELDEILSMYPDETASSYRFLLNYPAALIVMYQNLELTSLIGEYYRQSPLEFARDFEDFGAAVADRNASDVSEEENMDKILEELSKRSNQYAKTLKENSQSAQDEQTRKHYTQPRTRVSVSVGFGYSYWYGYPYWYRYPYW